jgi:hypothetical protein
VTDISLKYLLFGEDRTAGKAMKGVAGEAEKTGTSFHKNVVAGAAVAATAIVAFGKISVDKFKEVAGETAGLMRTMGGTAQSASELRFAAQQSGVTYETLSKSTGKFSKALVASGPSGKAQSAMIKTLGFDFRDAHGHVMPMAELLPKVSDHFKTMPAGAEKTALAMKLFGKAGTDMLPFLNKGSDGIKALTKESDKYGLTLTGANLDAMKKSKASQREWNASLDGLRVQIGAQVLPIMTKLVSFIRDAIIPIIVQVSTFFREHSTILGLVATVIGTVVVGMKALAIVTGIVNAVMDANPIGLIVIALAALAVGLIYAYKHSATFRQILQTTFHVVSAVFTGAWNVIKAGFSWVKSNWPYLLGILLGPFGLAAAAIYRHWDAIIGFLKKLPGKIGGAVKGMWDGIKDGLRSVLNWVIDKLNGFHFTIGGGSFMGMGIPSTTVGISGIPHLANGANILRGGSVLIGERGPERLTLPAGATVSPLGRDSGGGAEHIHLYIDGREIRVAQRRTSRLLTGAAS